MKKTAIWLLTAAVALSLAGCQQTPESPIVTGKSSDALIEKAAAETSGALQERVAAPERYKSTVSNAGDTLHVTIDAAVTVPEADKVPIVRVTPVNITQTQTDVLMEKLVQGELYEFDQPKSRAELGQELLELKQKLAEGPTEEEENTVYLNAGAQEDDTDTTMTWEEYMEDRIQRVQAEYDAAPETVEKKLASGQLESISQDGSLQAGGENTTDALGWEALRVIAGPEGQEYFSEAKYNRTDKNVWFNYDYYLPEELNSDYSYKDTDIRSIPDVTVTAEEAQAMCDDVVAALELPHMKLYAAVKKYGGGGGGQGEPRCCWELQYTRELEGIPLAYSAIDVGITMDMTSFSEGRVFRFPWTNERLNFYVNDEGIVGMDWTSPYALGEAVTEDAALLPFGDIMDIFEKMYVVENDSYTKDVTVDAIRLSYMRVSEQDKSFSGLLVPVWDFYGSTEYPLDDGESVTYSYPDRSLFTINAVDGSIIDRSVGY